MSNIISPPLLFNIWRNGLLSFRVLTPDSEYHPAAD